MQIKYPWYNLFCTRDYTPEAVRISGQVSMIADPLVVFHDI